MHRVSPAQSTALPAAFDEDGDFLPINILSLRLDSELRCDLYLQSAPDHPYVLYCQRSTPFTNDRRQKLWRNNIACLYIPRDQLPDYQQYLTEHLSDILADKAIAVRDKSEILYASALNVVERVLDNPRDPDALRHGKDLVHVTVDFMGRDDFQLEHLLRAISDNYYLYTHSVNVVAYAIALAMRAGMNDPAMLREMANGALLHDGRMPRRMCATSRAS